MTEIQRFPEILQLYSVPVCELPQNTWLLVSNAKASDFTIGEPNDPQNIQEEYTINSQVTN